jgi:hypothetical protein
MSTSFTEKSLIEVAVLAAGAGIAWLGRERGMAWLFGLGVAIAGVGVTLLGVGAIRRREIVFLHSQARTVTNRYKGAAAVIWGVLAALVGLVLVAAGVALGLGAGESLKGLVMEPAVWLVAGGVAGLLAAAAWTAHAAASKKGGGAVARLAALPRVVIGGALVLLSAGVFLTGVWGLANPQGLASLTAALQDASKR